jgi:hypothetical protein
MAGLDSMSMMLGGLLGGGKGGGSSSSSSSNASNVLNMAFNPNVFAATGDGGAYTPSSSGSPSGNATGSPSSSAGNTSPSSSVPWNWPSTSGARYDAAQPYTGGNTTSSTNNTMVLMLMLGVGALYMVSRS